MNTERRPNLSIKDIWVEGTMAHPKRNFLALILGNIAAITALEKEFNEQRQATMILISLAALLGITVATDIYFTGRRIIMSRQERK